MLLRSGPRIPFALLPAALICLSISAIAIPSHVRAQSTDFFRCTDRRGNVTITNRTYDPRIYTCTPFTNLNAAFRRAEAERRAEPAGRVETAGISAAESARVAAEAARTSMEAAQTAAQAAYITAEAVQRVLARNYFFILPR